MKRIIILLMVLILSTTQIRGDTMANTVITNVGVTTATGQITGLQAAFNQTTYISAGIALSACSSGQSFQPGGTLGSVSAPATGGTTSTPTFGLSGLFPGSTDTYYGWARSQNGLYYPAGSTSVSTYPDKPYNITTVSKTTTSLSINWSNSGGRDNIYVKIGSGSYEQLPSIATSKAWFGLSPGTSYTMYLYYVYNGLTGAVATYTDSTVSAPVRPSNFYWSPPIVQGNTLTTYEVTGNYYEEVMTATQWNSFTSRINDFRLYKGYVSIVFPQESYHSIFTGTVGQRASDAITTMSPSISPPSFSTGQEITATKLNQLQNSLNSVT